ncbi:COP9 signalosome complex subunit 3 isoform X2 [Toxorhynchites rutilus septentrionalis]|uniref:COP9 signalosome complex subunit 3 isoform X2 n=1 Tax=Toxorhynchites rutilus septentrionalis TaxID=329112 RepID=UPI002479EB01|nr:COP9 signalosome complex subunit 3 isoform X2 [Toxorhynchites rutilus septentrionalis]
MASPLEHYVNHVRSMSSAGNFRELVEYLMESRELLSKNGSILDNVLETLDIQQHSLGVLFVLVVKFNEPNNHDDTENVLRVVREFITLCNGEQVRFATQPYFALCHQLTAALVKNKQYTIQGIQVLVLAVEKIRLRSTQLTPVHADLCQLCLCAKVFSPALRFLDVDITSIANAEDSNYDTKYFLLYYYYGGMLYTAVRKYERALYFFETAISTPALAMSHIMLESYKKYILVSLILHGKVVPIPKYSSQVIARFMKPLSHAYHDLSSAYHSSNCDEVRNVANKYRETFIRDTNMGLVKQVVASLYKKNIQRLTKTFLTLSLADVASRVKLSGPVEAEKFILNMIKSGEIFASINQKDGMVVFKDNPEKYDSPDMFHKVQREISRVMEMNNLLLKMEEEIMLNPLYVKKSMGNQEDDIAGGQHSKSYSGDPTE